MRPSPAEPRDPAPRARRLLAPGAFFALAFALYANTLGHGFAFDDELVVMNNSRIRTLEGVREILRSGYRPVRHLSYALDYALWGPRAWGFHLTNVLCHAVACLLVFRVARRLAPGRDAVAWAAALLFAVHPVQTEAVAYVSGRRDLLVTIFFLLGLLSYLAYRATGRRRHVVALLAWFALAAGSKESAVTLPAVLLLHDLLVDPPPRRGLLFHVPFALLAVAFAVHVALGGASRQEGFHGGSAATHYMGVPCLYGLYLWRCVFPVRLLADYTYDAFPLPRSPIAPSFLGAVLAILGLCAAVPLLRRRAPLASFGIAWFLVTLLPVVQIVPFHELAAEHHLYLASIGLCLAAGVAFERIAALRVARAAAAALLAALAVRTVLRNPDWRDAETLWSVTARDAPRCARAHYNLGSLRAMRGRYGEALPSLRAAVRIRGGAQDRYALGSALLALDRAKEGRQELERALALAREQRNPPVAPGLVLLALGRPAEALAAFEEDLQADPLNPRARYHKGRCHEVMSQPDAALREYERLLSQVPWYYPALARAADLAERRGDVARAAALRARARENAPLGN